MNKKSKFNLSDGEEDEFEFQGLGAFSERDDFEDDMLPNDDGDYDNDAKTESTYGDSVIDVLFCFVY